MLVKYLIRKSFDGTLLTQAEIASFFKVPLFSGE